MGKYNYSQNNFINGEISKKASSRIDIKEYYQACDLVLNMLPIPQGGMTKRPGTRHKVALDNLANPTLLPYSTVENNGWMVAIKPNSADPTVTSPIQIFRRDFALGSVPWPLDLTNLTTLASNLEVDGFMFAQAGKLLFITHRSGAMKPFVIAKTGSAQFEGFDIDNVPSTIISTLNKLMNIPYLNVNVLSTTLTPSATTGSITLTSSPGIFTADHVGSYFQLSDAGVTGVCLVTAFTNVTTVTATVLINFSSTATVTDWRESAWSNERGWPRAVTFYQQRIVWGGTEFEPDVFKGSLVLNLFHMMEVRLQQDSSADVSGLNYFGSIAVTDPYAFQVAGSSPNVISWLSASSVLEIGTTQGSYIASGNDEILGNTSVNIRQSTSYNGASVRPTRIGEKTIFVSQGIRTFKFNFENGSHISKDLNNLADHISTHGFDGGVSSAYNLGFKQIVYQESRNILWCLTNNNELVGVGLTKETEAIAWFRVTIGGTDVVINGMTIVKDALGPLDSLYISVSRTINSSTVHHLEMIGDDFNHDILENTSSNENDYPWFSDSAIRTVLGSTTATVTGFDHLEGETLKVLVDNVIHADLVVSGGEITLSEAKPSGTIIIAGLQYVSKIRTVDLEVGGDFGTSQGVFSKVDRIMVNLYKSLGGKYGIENADNFDDIEYSDNTVPFTGKKRINISSIPTKEMKVEIQHDTPVPFTLLGIAFRGVAYD